MLSFDILSYMFSGATPMIRPDNGSNFRTITRVLKPEINHCYVCTVFTEPNQRAYARLIVTKINNDPLSNEYVGDSIDLVASGYSKFMDTGVEQQTSLPIF